MRVWRWRGPAQRYGSLAWKVSEPSACVARGQVRLFCLPRMIDDRLVVIDQRDRFVVLPAQKPVGVALLEHLYALRYHFAGANDPALKVWIVVMAIMSRHEARSLFLMQAGAR